MIPSIKPLQNINGSKGCKINKGCCGVKPQHKQKLSSVLSPLNGRPCWTSTFDHSEINWNCSSLKLVRYRLPPGSGSFASFLIWVCFNHGLLGCIYELFQDVLPLFDLRGLFVLPVFYRQVVGHMRCECRLVPCLSVRKTPSLRQAHAVNSLGFSSPASLK